MKPCVKCGCSFLVVTPCYHPNRQWIRCVDCDWSIEVRADTDDEAEAAFDNDYLTHRLDYLAEEVDSLRYRIKFLEEKES